MILYEYFWLLTKKLKFNVDKIKKPLKAHYNGFQYKHIYKDYFISNYDRSCSMQAL